MEINCRPLYWKYTIRILITYKIKSYIKIFLFLIVAFIALADSPIRAEEMGWKEAIANVSKLAENLWQKADRFNAPVHLGSALNEYMVKEHKCSILGRMLGKRELISHLEEDIDQTSTDGYELRLQAHSLKNWVHVAKNLVEMDRGRRAAIWNLDCVGYLKIPESAAVLLKGGDTKFYDIIGDTHKTLRIIAEIESGFAEKLREVLNEHPDIASIALGSHGGSVVEAISAGLMIRERGISTTLWNNCFSACPLVFIAGTERQIWSPYYDLGFHQVSQNGMAVSYGDEVYDILRKYVSAMGVKPDSVLAFIHKAAPDSIYTPSHEDLCNARIATWIQRSCWQ